MSRLNGIGFTQKIKLLLEKNNFKVFTLAIILLLGLGICISEPVGRHIIRILFVIAVAKFFIDRKKYVRTFDEYKIFFMLMFIFFAWLMISMLMSGNLISETDSTVYWIFFSHNMILFLPLLMLIDKIDFVEKVLIAVAISLSIDNFFVAYQFTQGIERPITFLKGSFMQGTMIYVILLPALLILFLQNNFTKKIFYGAIFLISLVAFILLNTRGAWIDLAIVLPLILIYHIRNLKKLLSVGIAFIIAAGIFLAVFPNTLERVKTIGHANSQQSVTERFLMWQSAINMIKDNPLTGVGLGNYDEQYQQKYILPAAKERDQKHSHNVYLQFWAETGLPGLILFCALFGYILYWSWKRRQNVYARILFFSTLALMLYGMTDYTISGYRAMRVYWFLFGLCIVGVKFSKTNLR